MIRYAKQLFRDVQGSTAVEFAVISPLVIMLLFGTFQLTYEGFAQTRLNDALRTSSRLAVTGALSTGSTSREQMIGDAITKYMGAVKVAAGKTMAVTISNAVTFSAYGSGTPMEPYDDTNNDGLCDNGEAFVDYDGDGKWSSLKLTAGAGGGGSILNIKVDFPMDSVIPFVPAALLHLTSQQTVENEQFDTSQQANAGICS